MLFPGFPLPSAQVRVQHTLVGASNTHNTPCESRWPFSAPLTRVLAATGHMSTWSRTPDPMRELLRELRAAVGLEQGASDEEVLRAAIMSARLAMALSPPY